jgi:hypothetical protein
MLKDERAGGGVLQTTSNQKGIDSMKANVPLSRLLRGTLATILLVTGMTFGAAASASVIGQLDFAGVWDPIDAQGDETTIGNATGVRFASTEYPILLALGAFSHLSGQNVTIETQEFQFAGPFPFTLWSADGGSVRFDLDSITVVLQSANFIDLLGHGTVYMDGERMHGRYLFTGQGELGFTFSSSTLAHVPEPATIGLLGMGLVGFGLMRRRTR